MVGGEERRIPPEDGDDQRMTAELLVEESADLLAVPAAGVGEVGVKREIPFVKAPGLQAGGLAAADGHVEDGQVQEGDGRVLPGNKVQGLSGLEEGFGRGAEEQVDIGGDAGRLEGRQGPGYHIRINALAHGVQHSLIT